MTKPPKQPREKRSFPVKLPLVVKFKVNKRVNAATSTCKTQLWEKERRNRINDYFNKLWQVLPIYDATKPISKPDILIHAASTIKDLDEKLKKVLVESNNEKSEEKLNVSSEVIKKLQDRVKKLLLRNEKLFGLLNTAGIKVPSEYGTVKKSRKRLKYRNAITSEQADILQKELEKENQVKPTKPRKPKSAPNSKKVLSKLKIKKNKKQMPTTCVLVASRSVIPNNSCIILSNGPSKVNQTVLTNSFLVKSPIVSSDIKPSIFSSPQLSSLGLGTLLFADGTVMPVVPPPRPLPILPTIIANSVSSKLMLPSKSIPNSVVVSKISEPESVKSTPNSNMIVKQNSILNSLPVLTPRLNITRTTQVNKVPIPSLTSKYNKDLYLNNSGTEAKVPPKEQDSSKECASKKRSQQPSGHGVKKSKLEPATKMAEKKSEVLLDAVEKGDSNNVRVEVSVANVQSTKANNTQETVIDIFEGIKENCNGSKNILTNSIQSADNSDKNEGTKRHSVECSVSNEVLETSSVTPSKGEVNHTSNISECHSNTTKSLIGPTKNHFGSSVSTSVSTNYQMESFSNVPSQSDAIKQVLTCMPSSISKHQNNMHILQSSRCNISGINTSTTLSSSEVTMAVPKSLNTLPNSNNVQSHDLVGPDKAYSASLTCLKETSKQYDLVNLHNQNTNSINDFKALEMQLPQTDLSNDIFASFQVPPGCQNPESTSPTAAFLLAFPLVSSGVKVADVMGDDNSESQTGTPNLLQIGTMDISKPTQSYAESLTPNLLNFDSFSFFNNKDSCGGFYNSYNTGITTCQSNISCAVTTSASKSVCTMPQITHQDNVNKHGQSQLKNQNVTDHFKTDIVANKLHQQSKTDLKSSMPMKCSSYHSDVTTYSSKQPSLINNDNQINEKNIAPPLMHSNVTTYSSKQPSLDTNSQNIEKNVPVATLMASDILTYPSKQPILNGNNNINNNNNNQNVKNIAPPIMHMNSNTLDLNNDIFSYKSSTNDIYLNSNKQMPGPSKSSGHMPNYGNFKSCNLSVNTSLPNNKECAPVYTSASIGNSFYNSFEGDGRNLNINNCTNYRDYNNRRTYPNNCSNNVQLYAKEKINHNNIHTKTKPPQNKPINWMTTPTTTATYKPDYFLPPFSKEPTFSSSLASNPSFTSIPPTTYFNSSVYNPSEHLNITQDYRKSSEMTTYTSYQRIETEDNQFAWSPNKMPQFLDTSHAHSFVSSTLPTLVGDLALNTPVLEHKKDNHNRDNRRKGEPCDNQGGQTRFLSVSQLVEPSHENMPAKVVSRRSSGNRLKNNTAKSKRTSARSDNKDVQNYQKSDKSTNNFNISVATNLFNESKQATRNNPIKNTSSNYSAEALIGNQGSNATTAKRNNVCDKTHASSFFNESVVSYFPPVEVSQDSSYNLHTSQIHQSNTFSQNFTTFQNNSYSTNNFIPSSCTITSSYIPTNSFMPMTNTQDFLGENANLFQNTNIANNKERCNFPKNYYSKAVDSKDDKHSGYNCKKAKKRTLNENVLPSFDLPFFSMPGAINSPILPDDFHTTYLPPTTLYSCKNPLYSKANTEVIPSGLMPPLLTISGNKPTVQHPQISPSVNSVGTSLTNFNLSTIFPEINKGPVQETFPDNRTKDYHGTLPKNYPVPPSLQVPFNNKSSSIF